MAGLDQTFQQAKQFWAGLKPRQRLMLGGGAVLTVALLGGFTKAITTPDMKPLMVGLEPADAQALSAQLTAKNITFQLSPDGHSINVPADQIDQARLQVASQEGPRSGRLGFELFDKVSWGQTEFDEKVNYQRALEGELERTIQTLGDVKSARVHLVMPKSSVFLDREHGAKASVTLRLKHGTLSKDQLVSISRLLSGAVDELAPADVAIIDADSNQALGSATAGGKSDSVEQDLASRLIATLGPAVGPENLRASVNVEYDLSTSEEHQDKYDPAVSALLTTQRSDEQTGVGGGVGGVPGTSSNLPNAKGGAAAAATVPQDGAQSSKTENSAYGVNKISRHTVSPAGRIRRITAALLVNDLIERKQAGNKWVETDHKRSPAELKQLADLAGAAIGLDTARGDIISVENMAFDHAPNPDIVPETKLDKLRKGLADYSNIVRYAALLALFLIVYLFTLRPMQKRVFASATPNGLAPPQEVPALAASKTAELATTSAPALPDDDAGTLLLKKQIVDLVQAEPATTTRAVQAWLREDPA